MRDGGNRVHAYVTGAIVVAMRVEGGRPCWPCGSSHGLQLRSQHGFRNAGRAHNHLGTGCTLAPLPSGQLHGGTCESAYR